MGIPCCIKKTVLTNVLKRKRIAKQNAIFSLEVRSRLEIQRALVLISTVSCSLNFHWTVFCLAARTWSCSTAWRHKNRSSTGSWPRFIHCSLLQRGFPFDFLFLSDWMECFFDLLSIKVKLKYPVTASPTCPFMINRSLDYSCLISIREALHCLWIDEVTIMYKICSLIVLSIIEQLVIISWNLWLFFKLGYLKDSISAAHSVNTGIS